MKPYYFNFYSKNCQIWPKTSKKYKKMAKKAMK